MNLRDYLQNRDALVERLLRATVCRIRGHKWGDKLNGRVCRRCSIFEMRT